MTHIHMTANLPSLLKELQLEKKYAPALDNYGQSCFVRSDFLKMKCVSNLTIRNYKQVKRSLTLCMMFYHTQLV